MICQEGLIERSLALIRCLRVCHSDSVITLATNHLVVILAGGRKPNLWSCQEPLRLYGPGPSCHLAPLITCLSSVRAIFWHGSAVNACWRIAVETSCQPVSRKPIVDANVEFCRAGCRPFLSDQAQHPCPGAIGPGTLASRSQRLGGRRGFFQAAAGHEPKS